jgi:NTE family protein
MLSNFPVALFDADPPKRPTFGLRLVDSLPTREHPWPPNSTKNVLQIAKALLHTMMSAHDRLYMDDHTYVRTIAIPVDGISSIQFDLTPDEAEKLYQNGRKAAEQFFATWDFEAYKAAFRGQATRGRRERLHEHMRRARQADRDDSDDDSPRSA